MTRLQQIRRRQERIVPIQRVHQRQIILVLLNRRAEVRKFLEHRLAKRARGQEAGAPGGGLDGHAGQDGFERVEIGGEADEWVGAREEAPRRGDHEGGERGVCGEGVGEDGEGRVRGSGRHDDR